MRRQREMRTLLLLIGLAAAMSAQESRTSPTERQNRSATEVLSTALPAPVPLDAIIDEAAYQVGPGDQFAVSIWTVPPQLFPLIVSAQGSLIIPLVGEVRVQGKTLSEVREEMLRAIRKKYLVGEPTVTLVAPRWIVVRVRGFGVFEGSYVVSASDRVQSLLARNDIRRSIVRTDPLQGVPQNEPVSILRRSIVIFRNSGEAATVDLDRFDVTRSSIWSPYLREGDEVIFPIPAPRLETVTVGGAVRSPGMFEWKQGDQLKDLLGFARGFHDLAMPESVQVFHSSGAAQAYHVGSSPGFNGGAVPLEAGDRVFVPSRRIDVVEALVSVEGEVRQSGQFPILIGRSRVSDVIAMAGGVTERAMLHAASVYRAAPEGGDLTLLRLTASRGNSAPDDSMYVRLENEARLYGERVSCDLVRALSDPSSADNVVLQPGDRIVIPRRTGTVYVFGQVASPGHVPFTASTAVEEYLRRAGGVTQRAKDGDIVLIKRATRQWREPGTTPVEEGDMIWVPRVVDRDLAYDLGIVAQIASIVSGTATLIILLLQIGR
ncbi:MAG: SLBB domain-containing protein [Bacteroidota bacterium]